MSNGVRAPYRPGVERRARILEAAQASIAEKGLMATTAREIAARCGISTGTLTHYFPSMDDLLVDALRAESKEMTGKFVRSPEVRAGGSEGLELLIRTALPDNPKAVRAWRLWLEYWARAVHGGTLSSIHSERYQQYRGAIAQVIALGVETGEFGPVDPKRMAREFCALFDGLGIQSAIHDEEVSVDEARLILREWIEARLRV